jgi:hypothetical protein
MAGGTLVLLKLLCSPTPATRPTPSAMLMNFYKMSQILSMSSYSL